MLCTWLFFSWKGLFHNFVEFNLGNVSQTFQGSISKANRLICIFLTSPFSMVGIPGRLKATVTLYFCHMWRHTRWYYTQTNKRCHTSTVWWFSTGLLHVVDCRWKTHSSMHVVTCKRPCHFQHSPQPLEFTTIKMFDIDLFIQCIHARPAALWESKLWVSKRKWFRGEPGTVWLLCVPECK